MNANQRTLNTHTMAVIKIGKSMAGEKGAGVLGGEALHAFVMANGLLDGCVFIIQPMPLFHTSV